MVSGATVRRVYILERLDSDCVLAHNQAKLDIEVGNASGFYVVRMLACSTRTGWPIKLEESELRLVWIVSGQPQAPGQAVMCINLHSAGFVIRRELRAGKSV